MLQETEMFMQWTKAYRVGTENDTKYKYNFQNPFKKVFYKKGHNEN